MDLLSDEKIIDSWKKNAKPWITAIQEQQIESRNLITNKAVIDTILSLPTQTVLDIGCGEGWLTHELATLGLSVSGVDVIPELIEKAREQGKSTFHTMAYEEISAEKLEKTFDSTVCNFSLLGNESVSRIFKVVPSLLNPSGHFIVQTLHPSADNSIDQYIDGWREGSWAGFSQEFCDPAPWYFRTMESWFNLFNDNGFTLQQLKETVHPKTGQVLSVIFVGRKN